MKNNAVLRKECHSQAFLLGIFRVRNVREMKHLKGDGGKIASGFTLMELLVVVLIIGILASIAVPQYQKAVLKSRFSALMPLGKSIKEAQELFYLEHGNYSANLAQLELPLGAASGSSALLANGTQVAISNDATYSYTLVGADKLKNHYVVWNDRSSKFPAEIHCEALIGDERANWLCAEGLGGRLLGRGITNGYTGYILQGSGTDVVTKTYLSQNEVTLLAGDSCMAQKSSTCNKILATEGSACKRTSSASYSCTQSTFDTGSHCDANNGSSYFCYGNTYKNESYCDGGKGIYNCHASKFFSGSYCVSRRGNCFSSTYDNAYCKIMTNTGYSGGCNKSTYQNNAYCLGDKGGCGDSTYKGGSICYANSAGACANNTYDDTSYCEGTYCPAGARKKDGTLWE